MVWRRTRGPWSAEEAAAFTTAAAIKFATAVVVVAIVVVVVVVVVVAIVVVAVEVGKMACWMKAERITSPAGLGLCPCPSPAFGGIDPSFGPTPSL